VRFIRFEPNQMKPGHQKYLVIVWTTVRKNLPEIEQLLDEFITQYTPK